MMKKSLTSQAGFLAFGNGSSAIIQIIVAAVLARLLTINEYGTYRQVILVFSLATPLLGLGLPASLLYYLPKHKEREPGVLSETLSVLFMAGLGMSAFLLLGGADWIAVQFDDATQELSQILRWLALLPVFAFPTLAVFPCLIAKQKPHWLAGYAIATGIARLLLILVPIWFIAQTPAVAALGYFVATVVAFVPGMYLIHRAINHDHEALSRRRFLPTRAGIVAQLKYAVPLGLGSAIGIIHKLTDKAIVAKMTSVGEFAIFQNGAMEIPFISLLTGSAAGVMVPAIAKHYADGNIDEAIKTFRRIAIKCGTVLAPIAGWFFIAAPWVMAYLYGTKYAGSAPVFRIYLLLIPIRVAFFGPLFQAAGRSDLVLSRSLVGFIGNIILTIVLTYYFGSTGAAIGTVVSIILFTTLYSWWECSRVYKVKMRDILPLKRLATLFAPVIASVMALMLLSSLADWETHLSFVGLAIVSLIYAIAVILAYQYLSLISIPGLVSLAKSRAHQGSQFVFGYFRASR